MLKRIIMAAVGVFMCGVSVAIFRMASFGVDPFQSFMGGVDELIPLSFGTLYMIVNALLLIFSLVFDKHYVGAGTFINLFLLGYVTEFTMKLFNSVIPEPSIPLRILFFIIAIVLISFSCSLYMTADLGVSTYDAIALIIVNKWNIGKFRIMRILTDLVCVILGASLFFLGGGKLSSITSIIGIGTIITAFFMGPLIDFFNNTVSKRILGETKKATE